MAHAYDNFAGNTIDPLKWTLLDSGDMVQTGGQVQITSTGNWGTGMISKVAFPVTDVKFSVSVQTQNVMVGIQSSPTVLDYNVANTLFLDFSDVGGLVLYVFHNGAYGPVGSGWQQGVTYEVSFHYNGPNVEIRINGGSYSNTLLISTAETLSEYISVNVQGVMGGPSALAVNVNPIFVGSNAATYFSSVSVIDGTSVRSLVDRDYLVSTIQAVGSDVYFDSTAEISRVDAYYVQQPDGRQNSRIIHRYPSFVGSVTWSPFARDGTWEKTKIVAYDFEGATAVIPRAFLDATHEDLTHSDGTMKLNT